MKNPDVSRSPRSLLIICVALIIFGVPLLSHARMTSTAVNVVNSSSREIRNIYLSHVDVDDWSGDQLSAGQTIAPTQSFTLSNVTCDQQQVKVIGEDQDGCFVSTVITCGENANWTITNDTPKDCGN